MMPVLLRPADLVPGADLDLLDDLVARSGSGDGDDSDIDAHLAKAIHWGEQLPHPGQGRTALLWEALATMAAHGLQLARTVEPHLDALAILAEAGTASPPGRTWGVYAAEGPGRRLEASRDPDRPGGGWLLTGDKPWCSLAGSVSHALVTAWVEEDQRGLFAVELGQAGVAAAPGEWVPRGLRDVRSTGLTLDAAKAVAVGGPGWYLERDGFAFGGIGVAAIWFGAAVAVWRRLAVPGSQLDQIGLMHLGSTDARLAAARALLLEAAAEVDRGAAAGVAGQVLAARVRCVVADAAEAVMTSVAHALGPKPLVAEADHAARLADLQVYVRQHHAERDEAALGRLLLEQASAT